MTTSERRGSAGSRTKAKGGGRKAASRSSRSPRSKKSSGSAGFDPQGAGPKRYDPAVAEPLPMEAGASFPETAGRLRVFLFDDDLDLGGEPGREWARDFCGSARRLYANSKVKKEIALHGGEDGPSAVAFHTRAVSDYPLHDRVRILAARAVNHARAFGYTEAVFVLRGGDGPGFVGPAAEGAALGAYRFDRYRKEASDSSSGRVAAARFVVAESEVEPASAAVEGARRLAREVNRARDLINEPGEVVTPEALAEEARVVARESGLEVQVWNEDALRAEGYPGLISVGQGSPRPPRLIVLRHRPKGAGGSSGRHLALVGKGITFDTGGISLKPPSGMWTMKGDMSGAAAVLRAMSAVARAGVPATVTGIVAAAENYVGPEATRPGDIFVARNGKSVMVDNTDAEGRLVLTDALARAGEEGATHIVDAATLTGAAVRALGTGVAAALGNDADWVREVIAAGEPHGEVFWELPLVAEYRDELRCDSADLKNIGGINAGTITAALFLEEFVPDGARWAHLDIAGPFLVEKPWKYYPKGATGFGVRALYEVAARFAGD